MDPPLCGLALISHHEVSDTDLHTTTSRGEKVIAIIDHNGYVLSPVPVVPVNRADTVLLPEGLKALKRVAKLTGLSLHRSYLNLNGGFDSKANRQGVQSVIFKVSDQNTILLLISCGLKQEGRNRFYRLA
jgi:hypothetical protein